MSCHVRLDVQEQVCELVVVECGVVAGGGCVGSEPARVDHLDRVRGDHAVRKGAAHVLGGQAAKVAVGDEGRLVDAVELELERPEVGAAGSADRQPCRTD